MGHAENDGVVAFVLGERVDDLDSVFVTDGVGIGPGIIDGDVGGVLGEGLVDVDDLGVADVGAVLLECDAEDENAGVLDFHALEVHALYGLVGDVGAHAVVHATGREHHAGQHAVDLCFLDEIIGIDRYAVAADETGRELDEVPLRRCCLDDVVGVDAHGVEYLGQLVHEGDVDVALRVLDDFRGFGDFDRGGFVGAVDED